MHTSHLYVSQNMACGSLLADNSTATLEHAERTHSVSAQPVKHLVSNAVQSMHTRKPTRHARPG